MTSRKRLKLLRADKRVAERVDDPEWAVVRVAPSATGPGYPRFDGERR